MGEHPLSSVRAQVWTGPVRDERIAAAIIEGGGVLRERSEDANVIIWSSHDHSDESLSMLRTILHTGVEWVQLDSAGVDHWFELGLFDSHRAWTRADYGPAVAEQVVAFLLAGTRRFPQYSAAQHWGHPAGGAILADQVIGFLGAGRIVQESIIRLRAFQVRIRTLSEPIVQLEGVEAAYGPRQLSMLLEASDHVVIAVPLTKYTRGMIGSEELRLIGPSAWLHNVSRGEMVDTNALVKALESGAIAGACLDVTDPEPLPAGHPLWRMENVLLTQHTANPRSNSVGMYAITVKENVRRFVAGESLLGPIDLSRGF
jgi:phosphoglycerate dehydrogenase-like enzyme